MGRVRDSSVTRQGRVTLSLTVTAVHLTVTAVSVRPEFSWCSVSVQRARTCPHPAALCLSFV